MSIRAFTRLIYRYTEACRRFEKGHRVRRGAFASLVLMLVEAGLGAGLVLFELVADNDSMARALSMGAHLINTFLLLAALAVTAFWASGGGRPVGLSRPGSKLSGSTTWTTTMRWRPGWTTRMKRS